MPIDDALERAERRTRARGAGLTASAKRLDRAQRFERWWRRAAKLVEIIAYTMGGFAGGLRSCDRPWVLEACISFVLVGVASVLVAKADTWKREVRAEEERFDAWRKDDR